jgi:hypothetical protein
MVPFWSAIPCIHTEGECTGGLGGKVLGGDDAGFFALEFVGAGELAAEEFDEAAGARAAVGADQAHAIEKDEELEDFGVFEAALGSSRGGLFGFV